MKRTIILALIACASISARAQSINPTVFTEADGSPRVSAPTRINFPSGTLTCSGRVCTYTAAAASPALTATYVGYGSGANVLTGTSDFTYATSTKTATITGAADVYFNLTGVSTASALRVASGTHPGQGGGVIFPFTGGDQTSGPGVWWCNGAYNACSRFNLNLGFTFQGGGTSTSPVKILKGSGTSSDGALMVEIRPDDGVTNLYPFGTSAGNTYETRHLELAAGGTNYFATKAADAITTNYTLVWPTDAAVAGEMLKVSGISSNVISTEWGSQILTNSATLDFGNVATIGCSDLTIALTGAVLGDPVILGVPNASVVANSSFSAFVSASDVVTVRFCALISGDPASGTFKVTVVKQ